MFFDNLQGVFFSVFRAKRNLWFESAGIVLSQVITMGVGLTALSNGWPLTWLILAYTIASGCVMLFGAFSLRRVYGFVPHLVFDTQLFKTFFVMAVPFGLAGIVGRFYSYADSMLMSKMLDAQHLGWWSVPYKMTFAFQFIPVALSTSLYAVFSALSIDNTKRIAELYEKGWQYLFIVSLPLAVGLSVVAEPLVVTLYSDKYLPSVPVLRILLVSLVFGYLTFVTGAALNATNNQKKQTLLLTATLILNITLNILLIPRLTILGSAISALLGNIFLATVGFILLRRVVPVSLPRILARFTATLAAAVAMGVVVYGVLHTFSFIPAIISGLIVYPLALYIFGGVTKEDIAEFRAKLFPAKKIV
jgi:O-antigen/teichoic acid export membrane protein